MKNIAKSNAEYTRTYENMRGVSFTGDQTGSRGGRYEYLENMYVDHEADGTAVESIPGFRKLHAFGKRINGIFSHSTEAGKEYIIVHAGTDIYRFESSERDNLDGIEPIGTVADAKSTVFTLGRDAYLMDGVSMYKITQDGDFVTLGDEGMTPHIPTMFVNGEPVEDRNLLSDKFKESYYVGNPNYFAYGTSSLIYEIIDFDKKTCRLIRSAVDITYDVYVPEHILYDGEFYRVVEIGEFAFGFCSITSLIVAPGVEKIGNLVCYGCENLKRVHLPETVREVGNSMCAGCTSLEIFAIRKGVTKLGTGIFLRCPEKMSIYYEGTEEEFREIENGSAYADAYYVDYLKWYQRQTLGIPVKSPALDIDEVYINGMPAKKRTHETLNNYGGESFAYRAEEQMLLISVEDIYFFYSCNIEFSGTFADKELIVEGRRRDFFSTEQSKRMSPKDAVIGCTISRNYDGKVFLSGNPELSGVVFYCSECKDEPISPTYIGARNFFVDGAGDYGVCEMLATHDSLAVFKNGDDGGGSIFYHTPKDSGGFSGKHYPASYVHGGITCSGGGITFYDDPLFISTKGVCSLEREAASSYREVKVRSSGINLKLLTEKLSEISLAEWCGYLALCSEGRIYLADSRDSYSKGGSYEYEWYYLNDIGTYTDSTRVYRYASAARSPYSVHSKTDERVTGTVMSVGLEDGSTAYYVEEDGVQYAVYPTPEMEGGKFSAAVKVFGFKNLLFFATESGDLCLFNNDKRGIAPDCISTAEDFDSEDYSAYMGREIHPYFYSFDGHAPTYVLSTVHDNCDVPYLAKSTVRSSLLLKCKNRVRGNLVCKVGTDTGGYTEILRSPASRLCFDMLDFSALSFTTEKTSAIPIAEGERGWSEKQITVYSNEFASPFGVYSINYRYKIKGKIQKN